MHAFACAKPGTTQVDYVEGPNDRVQWRIQCLTGKGYRLCRGRSATFGCNGTLVTSNCGEATFEELLKRGLKISGPGSENPIAYYSNALRTSSAAADPDEAQRLRCCWLVQAMQGASVAEVVSAARAALNPQRKAEHFSTPKLLEESYLIVKAFIGDGATPYVVSSSNPWSVRAAIAAFYNPRLKRDGLCEITPDQVIGVSVMLHDTACGRLVSDRALAKEDVDYRAQHPGRLAELRLTAELDRPCTVGTGKVDAIRQLLPGNLVPIFAAGAGAVDVAMLMHAQNRLALCRPNSQRFERSMKRGSVQPGDGEWLYQDVRLFEGGEKFIKLRASSAR